MLTSGVDDWLLEPPVNLLRLTLHPDGLARRIVNLGEYASHVIGRLRRVHVDGFHPGAADLLHELEALALVADAAPTPESRRPDGSLALPLVLRLDEGEVGLVSTIATFGSPRDALLSELALENLDPADGASREILDAALSTTGREQRGRPLEGGSVPVVRLSRRSVPDST